MEKLFKWLSYIVILGKIAKSVIEGFGGEKDSKDNIERDGRGFKNDVKNVNGYDNFNNISPDCIDNGDIHDSSNDGGNKNTV
jgi:hypothetical protein